MHPRALQLMQQSIQKRLPKEGRYKVADIGARMTGKQTLSHRDLFREYNAEYVGVDMEAGTNVDIIMTTPYRLPFARAQFDLVMAGQVFEHVPYPWVLLLELARVTKDGGYIMLTAPSRGHQHRFPYDCWRFYSDSWRALAAFTELELIEAHTDLPPKHPTKVRSDYAAIPPDRYWGDSLGVFKRPLGYGMNLKVTVLRELLVRWGNTRANLDEVQQHVIKEAKTSGLKSSLAARIAAMREVDRVD